MQSRCLHVHSLNGCVFGICSANRKCKGTHTARELGEEKREMGTFQFDALMHSQFHASNSTDI